MKIEAHNAQQYLNHCKALQRLAKLEYLAEAEELFNKLRRLEKKAERLCLHECNTGEDMDEELSKIEDRVLKLFGGRLKGFFINGDPRGYALKIEEDRASKIKGICTDFGRYGILAPQF